MLTRSFNISFLFLVLLGLPFFAESQKSSGFVIENKRPDKEMVADKKFLKELRKNNLPWHIRHLETGIDFLLVLPGSYERGAVASDEMARDNEKPSHAVAISSPFYMSQFEITNEQFKGLFSQYSSGFYYRDSIAKSGLDEPNFPVSNVSWDEAMSYSETYGFRLPTEAEWEFVAKAGIKDSRFTWGNEMNPGKLVANISNPSVKKKYAWNWEVFDWEDGYELYSPVGSFPANNWGFYDLIGNAWEWCLDAYSENVYEDYNGTTYDPLHTDGDKKVIRGGGWGNAPRGSRLTYRWGYSKANKHNGNGFRVVLPVSSDFQFKTTPSDN